MADFGDLGQEVTDACTAEALRRQVARSAPDVRDGFDGLHCVDCDEPIPALRLALWKARCVECQGVLETRIARGLR